MEFTSSSEKLSSQVLITKYGEWQALLTGKPADSSSRLWKGLLQAMPAFNARIGWIVGNGLRALFWLDNWIEEGPLLNAATQEIPPAVRLVLVNYFWTRGVGWNFSNLRHWLPDLTLQKLHLFFLSEDDGYEDQSCWKVSATGVFSTASLTQQRFRAVMESPQRRVIPWRRIWHFKGPLQVSFTIWAILHRALPTAHFLWIRHIISSPSCPACSLLV